MNKAELETALEALQRKVSKRDTIINKFRKELNAECIKNKDLRAEIERQQNTLVNKDKKIGEQWSTMNSLRLESDQLIVESKQLVTAGDNLVATNKSLTNDLSLAEGKLAQEVAYACRLNDERKAAEKALQVEGGELRYDLIKMNTKWDKMEKSFMKASGELAVARRMLGAL